ncbi:D-amino acid dehydrogenase [uncultured Ferrovibrio sp.]|jgi:D-amino-acid dehydrogenase|uniref:D-amino acid dehydrogenase n=1 Tax=uncultured Ferrovibrio sp. TaxID=1576913 RepID=UPI00262484E1|nr:D-amino acid dehydrogenase [uncultured Ferrovibrio sp.]
MDVVVIGSGVVGMTTAWRLAREGHRVTVLDRAATTAQGASHANGAQLSYSYVAPLASPSVWFDLPKLLLHPDSPMRFRPGFDLFQYRWLLKFLAACTRREAQATTEKLLRLAYLSREVLHQAGDIRGIDFAWTRAGKLVVYSSEKGLAGARLQVEYQSRLGSVQQVLDRDGCLQVEPSLQNIANRIVGGVYTADEEAADPYRLCIGIEGLLAGGSSGVRFAYGRRVKRLLRAGSRLLGVETEGGVVEGDAYILAAGVASRRLGLTADLDLPIYPIKGYSLSLPIANDDAAPRVSVTDTAHKVVYARLGKQLRVAGMADLVGESGEIDPDRLAQLTRQARETFPTAATWQQLTPWTGLRPATPKGLPILGESGIDNLLLNVGHGALGFTLAFGSAEVMAAQLAGRPLPVPAEDFSLKAA